MFNNKKEKEKELGSKVLKWWQDLPYLKNISAKDAREVLKCLDYENVDIR
ncbi:unnamed protein product, partial [marine sediment metagenome]